MPGALVGKSAQITITDQPPHYRRLLSSQRVDVAMVSSMDVPSNHRLVFVSLQSTDGAISERADITLGRLAPGERPGSPPVRGAVGRRVGDQRRYRSTRPGAGTFQLVGATPDQPARRHPGRVERRSA